MSACRVENDPSTVVNLDQICQSFLVNGISAFGDFQFSNDIVDVHSRVPTFLNEAVIQNLKIIEAFQSVKKYII